VSLVFAVPFSVAASWAAAAGNSSLAVWLSLGAVAGFGVDNIGVCRELGKLGADFIGPAIAADLNELQWLGDDFYGYAMSLTDGSIVMG
jgi:hypothetical protein